MSRTIFFAFLFLIISVVDCTALARKGSPLQVVNNVDLNRYIGVWYQIAYFPMRFQPADCGKVVTAEYGFDDRGRITVHNVCWADEEMTTIARDIRGRAYPTRESGKLKVQFFWPIRAPYWIIDLDEENYSYAVVSERRRRYLWILARDNEMSLQKYQKIVDLLAEKGFDIDRLVITGVVK